MNHRLVRRAADRYYKWLQKFRHDPAIEHEASVMSRLRDAARNTQQMVAWAERFFEGMIPRTQFVRNPKESYPLEGGVTHVGIVNTRPYERIGRTLVPEMSGDVIRDIQRGTTLMKSILDENPGPDLSMIQIVEELTAINSEWEDVEFRDGKLSVTIKGVELSDGEGDVDLGSFVARLNLSDPLFSDSALQIESLDNIESHGGFTHPHVNSEKLCTGDGDDLMDDALYQGRLEDYFRIVESILRTYNNGSPYEKLNRWYGPNEEESTCCSRCQEWIPNEHAVCCDHCHTGYCSDCSTVQECSNCERCTCDDCHTSCECGSVTCPNCSNVCCKCSASTCKECVTQCESCSKSYCEECLSSCGKCGYSLCDSCGIDCGYCGDKLCETCMEMECDECATATCDECLTDCPECDKEICKGCIKPCDDCGVSRCSSCEQEHNCLLSGVSNE